MKYYFNFVLLFATSQSAGSTKNGRDSISKRLGIKINHQQFAKQGNIIVRQKGKKFRSFLNTKMGKDFTIFAVKDGIVRFFRKKGKKYITIDNE